MKKSRQIVNSLSNHVLELILLSLCVYFAFTAPNFLKVNNLLNILRNVSFQGIIACGMTLLIICGEMDLSVGAGVAFYGCTLAALTKRLCASGMANVPAVLISSLVVIAIAIVIGMLISVLRHFFSVPSFITTLALMTALKGFGFIFTNGYAVVAFEKWFNFFGGGYVFDIIPFPAILFVFIVALSWILLSKMPLGRAVYAVGGNVDAARLAGINVFKVKAFTFCLTTVLTALSGILTASQIMSGTPTVASGWEMNVISAVIIGGASLSGGKGTIAGTALGMIFLGIILNGMTLMNISEYWQYVVKGVLILSAVLVNSLNSKRQRTISRL
jgi:ribose transport system permease protein